MLSIIETRDIEKLAAAVAQAKSEDVGGLATMASAFFNFNRKRLIAVASQQLLPSVREGGAFANDGGLMAYGPSFPDMYNIKTAKALGITLPTTLLARADEIVVRRT